MVVDGLGPEVERWWSSLSEPTRDELVRRWTALPLAGSCRRSHEVPLIEARPVDDDGDSWNRDYYEYLLSHPEAPVIQMGLPRTVHICTGHWQARAALREGRVCVGFVCPLGRGDCPMRRLVADGRSKKLVGHGLSA